MTKSLYLYLYTDAVSLDDFYESLHLLLPKFFMVVHFLYLILATKNKTCERMNENNGDD